MKILLDNNLEFLYQWDLDRYIYLVDIKKNEKIKINFTNKAIDKAIVQEPKTINDLFVCKIPNSLLQYDKDLTVYIVENNKVIFSKTFKVIGRNKPENYVYTDEEQKLYERMEENLLSEIDKKGDSLEYSDNVLSLLSGDKEISKVEIRTGETKVNYEDLNNLPSINDVELRGNKTLDELNIQTKGNYIEDNNYNHTDNNYTTEDKDKLQTLENYDDTQVKELIKNLDSNKADKTEIPTRVSQLENDSNYLTQHQDISTKQDTLISGTNIKTINNNSLLGEGNLSIPIPTKVSQLTNDSNFITNAVDNLTNYYLKTNTYSKEEVNNLVNAIKSFDIEVVESLPIVMKEATIYLVPNGQSEENNFYNEYIYVNSKVELIGNTKVDISGKQDAPKEQGTDGQILGLSNGLPKWIDFPSQDDKWEFMGEIPIDLGEGVSPLYEFALVKDFKKVRLIRIKPKYDSQFSSGEWIGVTKAITRDSSIQQKVILDFDNAGYTYHFYEMWIDNLKTPFLIQTKNNNMSTSGGMTLSVYKSNDIPNINSQLTTCQVTEQSAWYFEVYDKKHWDGTEHYYWWGVRA